MRQFMVSTGNELLFDADACHLIHIREHISIFMQFERTRKNMAAKLMSLIMHNFRLSILKMFLLFLVVFLPITTFIYVYI